MQLQRFFPDRYGADCWKRPGHTCMLGHLSLSGFFPYNKYYENFYPECARQKEQESIKC